MTRLILILSVVLLGLIENFTNVGRGAPVKQGRAFRKTKRFARKLGSKFRHPGSPIFGFAEVGEGDGRVDEEKRLTKAFKRKWRWRIVGLKKNVPIVLRTVRFKIRQTEKYHAAKGRKGVGPNRWIIVVVYHDRVRKQTLARINTHFHAGAWNKKHNRYDEWRQEAWLKHMALLQNITKDVVEGRGDFAEYGGIPATVSADFNPGHKNTKPHPDAKLAAKHATDRIWAVPSEDCVAKIGKKFFMSLGIDFHKSLSVSIVYKKKRKR